MKKICVVCKNEFECWDNPVKHGRKEIKRKSNSITCSRKCSKEWSSLSPKKRKEILNQKGQR